MNLKINSEYKRAVNIIDKLENNNFECYFVGGCVRDKMLGFEVNDYDLVTNASTDDIIDIYKNEKVSIDKVGKNFGVLIVNGIELAQYRTEHYNVVSKPEVEITNSIEDDSKRRDFTVNSLYMDKEGNVLDFSQGCKDIELKIIRCVGDTDSRFKEDPSRILRALYLKTKLNFSISKELEEGIIRNGKLLELVPKELVGKIVLKVIDSGKLSEFMEDIVRLGLSEYVFTEFNHLKGLEQNSEYHCYDAWEHTLAVVRSAENKKPGDVSFILGALYHDCAKGLEGVRGVNKQGKPNDIGHEIAGSKISYDKVISYGFGKKVADDVRFYVAEHGVRIGKESKMKSYVKWLRSITHYFKSKSEMEIYAYNLIEFVECDASGFGEELKKNIQSNVPFMREGIGKALEEYMFYNKELPVSGNEIMSITGQSGKDIGYHLDIMLRNNMKSYEEAVSYLEKKK